MPDDQVFRWILIAGFLLVIPIAAYHRIKSQMAGDRLDRRQEGLFILLTLRPIGLSRIAGLIAFMINPSWMAWSQVPLSPLLRWVGVCLGIFAALLLIWVFRSIGTNLTDTVVTRARHTLVTHGPYRYVRHPFYSTLGLAIVADSLVTANWAIAISGVVTFALLVMRTRIEEEKLIERFGEDYRRYMEKTRRFLPIGRVVAPSRV